MVILLYVVFMVVVFLTYSSAGPGLRSVFDGLFVVSNTFGLAVFIKTGNIFLAFISLVAILMCGAQLYRNVTAVFSKDAPAP